MKKKERKKCFEMNENENNIPKTWWIQKAILREALYFVNAYVISKKHLKSTTQTDTLRNQKRVNQAQSQRKERKNTDQNASK